MNLVKGKAITKSKNSEKKWCLIKVGFYTAVKIEHL